ncbi:MAG: flagellar assembly peptidoglycan hydrolase FlgJ, partial [Nitrosospira sp.]|nr:flagellar assembly peptidoglycan hydrolase FlgJ [Nitrosospira sp.]
DFSGLNRLRQGVRAGADAPLAQQKAVAHRVEALFIQMVLKQACQTSTTISSLFDSSAIRMARSLQNEQVALQMANPGLGLAQALLNQIRSGQVSVSDKRDPLANASQRSPSRLDEGHRKGADSISALIDTLNQSRATERVGSIIRGVPGYVREFVAKMSTAADYAATLSGVPAKLILSQAALESGWGRREILREDGSTSHNLFGIKATGNWQGDVVYAMTTEYENGVARKIRQPFRAYDSYTESFADYVRLIRCNERYRKVLTAPSAQVAAQRMQEAGYASDPSYADKLIAIMAYFDSD